MDPDGKQTSTRAVLLAATGQNPWPPAGSYMAATGQDLMAADIRAPRTALPSYVIPGSNSSSVQLPSPVGHSGLNVRDIDFGSL